MPVRTIGGIPVGNTADNFTEFSRMAGLIWAQTGFGKTTLLATVDQLCQKHMGGKRALFVAMDEGDGGGTNLVDIRKKGIPLVEPKSLAETKKLMAGIVLEKDIGAVLFDDGTSFATKYVQSTALTLNQPRASSDERRLRELGVPIQADYQTIGEFSREFIISFIGLSTFGHPEHEPEKCRLRKHVFMTAQERIKTDRNGENIEYIGPAFPGSLPTVVASKFPLVCTIKFGRDATTKQPIRYVQCSSDNPKEILKDRSGLLDRILPMDVCQWYEQYWLPEIQKVQGAA